MAELEWDTPRVLKVLPHLIGAFVERQQGFHGIVEPEILFMPPEVKRDERKRAILLWGWAGFSRAGRTAYQVISRGAQLFLQRPWPFDPLMDCPEEDYDSLRPIVPFASSRQNQLSLAGLAEEVEDKGEQEARVRIQGWKQNRELMRDRYGGDPGRVFYLTPRDRNSLIEAWCQFDGFGQKVAQLLIIWFQEVKWQEMTEWWEQINEIEVMPVDLWVLRLARQLKLVTAWNTDHRDALSRTVSDYLSHVCQEQSLSHIELSQAFWNLGAIICAKRPKDLSQVSAYCHQNCPVEPYCTSIVPSFHYLGEGVMGWDKVTPRPSYTAPPRLFVP